MADDILNAVYDYRAHVSRPTSESTGSSASGLNTAMNRSHGTSANEPGRPSDRVLVLAKTFAGTVTPWNGYQSDLCDSSCRLSVRRPAYLIGLEGIKQTVGA